MSNIRSFIAVDLGDEGIRRKLVAAQGLLSRAGADLKLVEEENIHVTLRFLDNVPKGDIDRLTEELSTVEFKPFRAEIRGIGVFPALSRPRVVWAGFKKGGEELEDLFQRIEPRVRSLGIRPDSNPFHPHLTLARVGSGKNRDRLVQQIMAFSDEPFGEILVDSFQLKKSTLTPRGPIYETLRNFKAEEG